MCKIANRKAKEFPLVHKIVLLEHYSLESIQNRQSKAVSCDDCYYRLGCVCIMTLHQTWLHVPAIVFVTI